MIIRRVVPPVLGILIVVLLTALRIADPFPVQVLREIAFDFYQRLQPREADPGLPVRVIDIDEASLAELGQWPWPRDRLATLADRLTQLGAAAVGFDVLFPEADRMSPSRVGAELPGVDVSKLVDYDAVFATALANSPSILGFSLATSGATITGGAKAGFAISGPDPSASIPFLHSVAAPLPALRDAAHGLAAVSLNAELSSGTVRQLPLLWTNGEQLFPSLAIESLRVALQIGGIVVLGDTAQEGYVDGLRLQDFSIPTLSNGDLWLYYSPPRADLYVSAKDILGPNYQSLADKIAGHIVLIGTSASGLLDIHTTTLGDNVPGVAIHAQAIEQILTNTYLTRPDWVQGLEWLEFMVIGIALVAVVLSFGPFLGLLMGGVGLGGTVGFSWWMFTANRIMVDPSYPVVGLTLIYLGLVFFRFLTTDQAKRQIRRAFGYYVDPTLLVEIERSSDSLKLGGDMRQVTVMFTDVRGFTPLSEKLEPRRILALLNTLFSALGAEIVGQLGTIDKFIGDSIMAFWNAPVDVKNHEQRAAAAALGMRKRLHELNSTDAFGLSKDGPVGEVRIGIGLCSGEALVGNMGLETRFDYSALGDTVNVASRVEGACKEVGYDIVVAHSTRAGADGYAFLEAGSIQLKGKSQRVPVHILVGDPALAETGAFKLLRAAHEEALAALRDGRDAVGAIAECMALAARVEPGLARFYGLLEERRDDIIEAAQAAAA